MSTLKLKGSSSGEAEVTVAAAAGTPTFTLPTTVGSANQLLKNSGTAGTLEYSSNLTWDGTNFIIGATGEYQLILKDTNNTGNGAEAAIGFKGNDDATLGLIGPNEWANGNFKVNNSTSGGSISFETHDGTSVAQRASISSSGHLTIDDGNLVIGTSGKGIDFSATGDHGGMTSEILDTYEEGTWSPQIYYQNSTNQGDATNLAQYGWYTVVGNICHIGFFLRWTLTGSAANDNMGIKNMPFAVSAITSTYGHAGSGGQVFTAGTGHVDTNPLILQADTNNVTYMILSDHNQSGNMGNEIGAGTGLRIWGSLTYRI